MEKRYLAMQIWLCEDKLKGKTAQLRLPSAPCLIGSLSTRVFEVQTATGSELFSLFDLSSQLSSHNHVYIAKYLFSIRDD